MSAQVLILRDPARAAELIRLLESSGVIAQALPVTRTEFLRRSEPQPNISHYQWLAFTSVNGVGGFCAVMPDVKWPEALRIAVVGPGTAEAAAERIRPPDLVAAENDAQCLAAEIAVAAQRQQTVLWPCALKHGPDFVRILTSAGVHVHPWPVYATVPLPPEQIHDRLLTAGNFRIAVFAAPSAVSAFAAARPLPWNFTAVAIGAVTARALNDAGATHIVISRGTSAAELFDCILEILAPIHS